MAALKIYKPESAVISRWILVVSIMALSIYGCWHLYLFLPESWRQPFGGPAGWGASLGEEFPISAALAISIAIGLGAGVGTFLAANHPKLVDFFAETEVEMTKVSWSSRKDVLGSSAVVIATVVILGVWIGLVDVILSLPWRSWIAGIFS